MGQFQTGFATQCGRLTVAELSQEFLCFELKRANNSFQSVGRKGNYDFSIHSEVFKEIPAQS